MQEGESVSCVANAKDEDHARAIQTAAREVFEETGLLCVRGTLPSRELLQQARHRVLQGDLNFTDFLAQHAFSIDAADFEPAGRWLTPSFLPIRLSLIHI